jgi:hypothetical protein
MFSYVFNKLVVCDSHHVWSLHSKNRLNKIMAPLHLNMPLPWNRSDMRFMVKERNSLICSQDFTVTCYIIV